MTSPVYLPIHEWLMFIGYQLVGNFRFVVWIRDGVMGPFSVNRIIPPPNPGMSLEHRPFWGAFMNGKCAGVLTEPGF